MAFPEDPLGLRVDIQAGQVWTDITADVKTADPITHSRGIRNSGTSADPASAPLKIDNKDGRFTPRNPMSPYYGLIGRNTPVRLWLPGGAHFLDASGRPTDTASTPDTAALNITGDLDLRAEVEANWYEPGAHILIGKWDAAGGQRSYMLRLENGQLVLHMANGPTGGYLARWNLPALPRRAALRATHDVDNGAGGSTLAAYWATSMAGPWTLIEAGTGPSFAPGASTAPLVVAPQDLTQAEPRRPFTGKAYAFEVRNGIDGPVVAAPNFEAQPLGTTSFTDSAGSAWTLSGAASIADRQELLVGEIPAWPQKWVPSGQAVWTTVEAAGILRRLGQGQKALDSTLRRRIPSANPVAYWPMEEDRDATRAYSPIKGVTPAAVTGVEFASVDTLPSSRALPRLTAAATLSAIVPPNASGQWQVECVYNADDKTPPSSGNHAEVLSVSSTGTIRRWVISMRADSVSLDGYDASGANVASMLVAVVQDIFHGWYRLRLYAQDLGGGQMECVIGWANVDGTTMQLGKTITGTPGRVTAVTANWGPLTEGWSFGHLSVMPTAANTIYNGSDSAYAGETAWARMLRLANEEGLPIARVAGPLATERVGPQRSETLVELLQAAAEVDGGMLLEDRARPGLLYRDRSSLYTQAPALTLTYGAPGLAPPLEPVDDDTATRNDIVVSRDGGSSARAVLEEGPLSVQQPPDGIGLYDESVTLALNDDVQPEPHAYWRLHLGTFDGARYPSVRVLLHKAPALIPQVLALREGDVIRIKGLPGWVAYGDVDLIVTGFSETLLPRTWEIVFTCAPAGPWMTAKTDHPVYGKADTDGSALAGPVTSTDSALAVRTTAGREWTADPMEAPFGVQFGGEVARVDAVGQLLSPNPWFDAGLTGWVGQATGSVVLSTEFVHPRGTVSAKVTPNGSSGSNSLAMSTRASAVAAQQYTGAFWVYFPGGGADVRVMFDWYNSGGTLISTTSGPATVVPAGVWTYFTFTATAPALTTSVSVRVREGNSPTVADVYYVWGIRLLGPGGGAALLDTFGRTVANGWGSADTGQPWSWTGGAAADYAVNGTVGQHVMNTRNILRYTVAPAPSADVDVRTDWALDKAAIADSTYTFLMARYTDTTHLYFARVQVAPSSNIFLTIRKRNGAEVQLGSSFTVGAYTPGTFYTLRLQVSGSTLQSKCWQRGTPEPDAWQITTTDTDLTAAGSVGCRSLVGSASTQTLPVTASFDNFQILDAQTFTVTRSVNGVVKSHVAGAPFSLAYPAIASL